MISKQEALAKLQRAQKYGDMPPDKLSKLTPEELIEFGEEVARFWNSGNDDVSRDAAQREYLTRLASDLGSAL